MKILVALMIAVFAGTTLTVSAYLESRRPDAGTVVRDERLLSILCEADPSLEFCGCARELSAARPCSSEASGPGCGDGQAAGAQGGQEGFESDAAAPAAGSPGLGSPGLGEERVERALSECAPTAAPTCGKRVSSCSDTRLERRLAGQG